MAEQLIDISNADPDAGLFLQDGEPGSLITEDFQIEWAGMLMGPGTGFGYKLLTGWDDLPSIKGGNVPLPLGHGSWPGQQYMDDRIVTFTTQLHPLNREEGFPKIRKALLDRTNIEQIKRKLTIRTHGETLYVWARVTARVAPIDKQYMQGFPQYTIQWTCPDPRRYRMEQQFETIPLGTETAGLPWDTGIDWDAGIDWGSYVPSGKIVETHGSSKTHPTVVFHGPLTAPYSLSSPNWNLGMKTDLGSGQTLTVDAREGTMMLGSVDRGFDLTDESDLPDDVTLSPGETVVSLVSSSGADTGYAELTWQDATE